MKIYLLTQNENNGYDTFDAMVVSAENADIARTIKPDWADKWSWLPESDLHLITVKYLGETVETEGVILASFNAG